MNRIAVATFCALIAVVGGVFALARLRSESGGAVASTLMIIEGSTKHLVTKEMADASKAMVERTAPHFEAVAVDGRTYNLGELRRRGPVVLTFAKFGCPCSEAAQPFFNRLHAAYPEAGFFGVIDVEAEKATRWAERFRIDYPLLLDPALQIVRAYEIENSAYVVVVDADGRILNHWPGYSSGMLQELGATLARLSDTAERPIDVVDAPDQEYSGCPFDL
ncbi:peroxiredoxin family protein [Paludisphaera borealis]|uniref:Thiol-disulfide oxidoreductase ResA n=1 Tax=Paludisphaera borealis TaxID=1387353 RepID=A0A1U7CUC4_9BACT|nr:redoxin domain-containing protein [Paludisphaera borealis]APW62531.1 Thiol-disulfide oxidoreductase ResA [Paludisphaera borealis]